MSAPQADPAAERRRTLLDARSAALAARGAVDALESAKPPFLVCACGPDRYGLPMEAVARVMPARPCAPVPGAPSALLGLVAVAGRVVSVLDLARALGRGEAAGAGAAHFVVLRGGDAAIALAVDRVVGVVSADTQRDENGSTGGLEGDFGADVVSGYAATGVGADGKASDGFVVIDPPSLLRRFLS